MAVFVFDGDCAFCTSSARFLRRWVRPAAPIEPWQRLDLPALGLTREACLEAVQWVPDGSPAPAGVGAGRTGAASAGLVLASPASAGGRVLAGPAAVGAVLRAGLWPWRPVGWLLGLRPVQALAWPVYRWVARNRHRLPGGTPACALPQS